MITVIGAGILGASCAYHLAKKGEDVTIIDREEPGRASHAAAGIVCPWLTQRRNKDWYVLVKDGARYYPDLVNQLNEDGESNTGYEKVGALHLHRDPAIIEKMYQRGVERRKDAPEIGELTKLNEEETQAYFPALGTEFQSVHIAGGARVNGRALKDSLLRAAQKHGARYVNADATLIRDGNRVSAVHAGQETIDVDQVIDTTGAWSNQLLSDLGLQFNVRSQRAQILHLELPDQDPGNWPVIIGLNKLYLLTNRSGRVIVGATHEDDVGFDHRATAEGIHEILNNVLSAAPGLNHATFKEVRVGFRPFTPNSLPLIGPAPKTENLFVANGLGSSGLTSGPYLGYLLSQLATGQDVEIDLTPYNVEQAMDET